MTQEIHNQRRFPRQTQEDMVANAIAEYDQASAEANRVIAAQQAEIEELKTKLYIDKKTGVYNENTFDEKLPALIGLARKNDPPVPMALVIADTDGLKRTNAAKGLGGGDLLLIATAQAIKEGSRADDTVGRRSGDKGDEFYAILPGYAPVEGSNNNELFKQTVDKYRNAIGKHIAELKFPDKLKVGVSFGIGVLTQEELIKANNKGISDQKLVDLLIENAEKMLLENKELVKQQLAEKNIEFADDRQ